MLAALRFRDKGRFEEARLEVARLGVPALVASRPSRLWYGSPMAHVDLAGFRLALMARASDSASRSLDHLEDGAVSGIRRRYLVTTTHGDDRSTDVSFVGDRESFRASVHGLMVHAADEASSWLIRWTLGRWPRGPLTLALPLDRAPPRLALGIVAPLTPTRLALSEGPVPLDAAGVRHFRALHEATGAEGLIGCRVRLLDREPVALSGRWPLDAGTPERLLDVAASWELEDVARDLGLPLLEGLLEGSPEAEITLEAAWTPEPEPSFALEVGPLPARHGVGLGRAALGESAGAALAQASRDLHQRTAYRVRVELDAEGLAGVSLVLGPRGQPEGRGLKGSW